MKVRIRWNWLFKLIIATIWLIISVLLSPKHRFIKLKNYTVILIALGWSNLKFLAVIRSNTHPINLFCNRILTIYAFRLGRWIKNFDKNSIAFCALTSYLECSGLSVSSPKFLQMLILNSIIDYTKGLNFLDTKSYLKKFSYYWYTIFLTFLLVHISTNIFFENVSISDYTDWSP